MSRIAAIDCGTNTIKLLIADWPRVLVRESRVVRLGAGVDATGELAAEALARTFAAIEEYADLVGRHGVERLRFCATSATRDATNAADFARGVEERLGVVPEVLSGEEEAALVHAGVSTTLPDSAPRPVLAVDIGGGSTELVLGADEPEHAVSLDIGSVRLHERFLHDDPPSRDQVAALVAEVDEQLDHSPVPLHLARTVVGTSGTVKTVAAGVLGLPDYDREALDGARPPVDRTLAFVDELVAMSVAERRTLPYVRPGREDVVGAGGLIWSRILRRTGVRDYRVSEADVLHGMAATLDQPPAARMRE